MRVCALLVTYQPDLGLLTRAIRALVGQVSQILVLDNASANQGELAEHVSGTGARLHRLSHNLGLARAQNLGARWAWRAGFDAVLLLDQDSVAAPGMVGSLVQGILSCRETPIHLAAVAPVPVDPDSGRALPVVRSAQAPRGLPDGLTACDFLIASGMLIPAAAWRAVGPMLAPLFIDLVDTEWCLRARHARQVLAVVPQARLEHRLGDHGQRVWLGRWRYFPHHSPLRHYYLLRNTLRLRALPHVPRRLWTSILWRSVAVIGMSLLFLGQRRQRLVWAIRALRDAINGRLGPARH